MKLMHSNITGASPQLRKKRADDFVRVNLLVPASLRKEWKAVALAADKTLTELIIEAMHEHIKSEEKSEISAI